MARSYTIWIIAQQDGEHLLEYDLMLRSIIRSFKQNEDSKINSISVIVYQYDQERKLSIVKKLEKTDHPKKGKIYKYNSKKKNSEDESDIYDKKNLVAFFKENRENSQNCNIIIIWGHGNGNGFGFFSSPTPQPVPEPNFFSNISIKKHEKKKIDELNSYLNSYIQLSTALSYRKKDLPESTRSSSLKLTDDLVSEFSRIIENERRLSNITAAELSEIITTGLGKADLLIVNSCYMQTLESNAFLANAADIIVAPQTTFPFLGYDFEKIFSSIFKGAAGSNRKDEIKKIAQTCIASLNRKYNKQPFTSILEHYYQDETINIKNEVAISAINLSDFSELIEITNKIGSHLNRQFQNNEPKQKIISARLNCENVIIEATREIFIDFENFLAQCSKNIPDDAEFKKLFRSFRKIKKSLLLTNKKADTNKGRPLFINISMPELTDEDEFDKLLISFIKESFTKNENLRKILPEWGEFILSWITREDS